MLFGKNPDNLEGFNCNIGKSERVRKKDASLKKVRKNTFKRTCWRSEKNLPFIIIS